jgi:hypothetical protein
MTRLKRCGMNGLCLCVLHHKTFDLGAFTVSNEGVLLVSDQAHGSAGFEEALLRHYGRRVRPPQRPEWRPHIEFLAWHGREVFKGAARHVETQGRLPRLCKAGHRPTSHPGGATGLPTP